MRLFAGEKEAASSKRQKLAVDQVAMLSAAESAAWVGQNTEWGADFNTETQTALMKKIWTADRHRAQRWKVTCKRRRERNGISRLETLVVAVLDSFPSRHRLEEVLAYEGYGGGVYYISSTRGARVTHTVVIEGEHEEPRSQTVATKPGPVEQIKRQLDEIAFRYLKENPDAFRIVAIRCLEKKLGVKIPLPPEPDPGAPRPYAELSFEEQEWLDQNPEAKDEYMARELGIEVSEEEKPEAELLRRLKEKIIDDLVNQETPRPSEVEAAVSGLLEKTDPGELIQQVATLWQTLKGSGPSEDDPGSPPSQIAGPLSSTLGQVGGATGEFNNGSTEIEG